MTNKLLKQGVATAYDRWAPVYDLIFGPVFRQGRRAAIAEAEKVGGRILEVGVGTGISLPHYTGASRLYGVDISEQMLEKARARVANLGLTNVEDISVMDAEHLEFPDDSFDVVVAQYVVTAVPNPERALDEFVRVVRSGGLIVIATRIGAEGGVRGGVEKMLMPITCRLGWRTDFAWQRYARWASCSAAVELVERRPLPPLGHFALLCFRKATPSDAQRQEAA